MFRLYNINISCTLINTDVMKYDKVELTICTKTVERKYSVIFGKEF